jgi:hypothetical protein
MVITWTFLRFGDRGCRKCNSRPIRPDSQEDARKSSPSETAASQHPVMGFHKRFPAALFSASSQTSHRRHHPRRRQCCFLPELARGSDLLATHAPRSAFPQTLSICCPSSSPHACHTTTTTRASRAPDTHQSEGPRFHPLTPTTRPTRRPPRPRLAPQ